MTDREDIIARLTHGLEALDRLKKAEPLLRRALEAAHDIAKEIAAERDELRSLLGIVCRDPAKQYMGGPVVVYGPQAMGWNGPLHLRIQRALGQDISSGHKGVDHEAEA